MDRWGRSGPVEGGAGQGGSGGQKNFLVGLGLLAPPSRSPTPLNDSYLRACVNHDSNAYVHTCVRMQVHRKHLKSMDGGGRESREEGKRDHGKMLTYLRGNGGAAGAASRGDVLGEDVSGLASMPLPGTSS